MDGTYRDGSYDSGKKELVAYFVILRMPDAEPKLLNRGYVFTDNAKKLSRRLRFDTPIEPEEAEYLDIAIHLVDRNNPF